MSASRGVFRRGFRAAIDTSSQSQHGMALLILRSFRGLIPFVRQRGQGEFRRERQTTPAT